MNNVIITITESINYYLDIDITDGDEENITVAVNSFFWKL